MEITGEAEYQKAIGNEGLLNKSTPIFRRSFIAPESQASMKDFLDPSTLSDRLRERDTLYQPYLSADGLWHLGCFIVKRRHEDGSVATLLYTIQNIDEVKRTEIAYQEKLKKSAREAQIANQAKTDFLRRVIGSPTFLRRVLLNLSSNALKYNRRGGRIDFSCDKIEIKGEKAYFTLTCADTGIGMSPSFQSRAFEPFTQESDTARTHYMGTGLGLSIVKELVSKMGGTITLSSQKGVGTRFTITIPFTIDHASQEAETASQSPVSLSGLHVLLVEDNELNREIALYLLEKEGMEITTCENGAEAVKVFRESPLGYYDLILMDIMMPVMDGYEASRRIRSLPRRDASLIPIFAMTANAFQDDIEKSHKSGMNEHLTKPLHTKTMLSAIRKYVR